ncbi:uncharacterized protein A4U43_C05F5590 [Asparagus officinalis]|uniref:Transcription elongation factor n=1 Tax=Asparagus officinalis TaxID=4686 RepID=A0A5P1EPL2_ASPOF|nr:transcription elongation factor TFIIS-like [Asparagus officinalis]ONK67955.1 uncharacterized protein A4U43_C05F5590 [Asparagus officinalis]
MEKELLETFEAAKKARTRLAEAGGSPEADRCVDALKRLRKMPVTMGILVKTQVGKRLRALAKHPQKKIQAVASDLLNFWKNIVIEETAKGDKKSGSSQSSSQSDAKSERTEPLKGEKMSRSESITSRSQSVQVNKVGSSNGLKAERITKTETKKPERSGSDHACFPKLSSVVKCNDTLRDKLREILAEAFSRVYKETSESERDEVKNILDEVDACDPFRVAVTVESAMYEKFGSSNGSHKMKYRSIMFNLKDSKNPDFRRRVLLGHVKPERIVDMTPEEMASDERKLANKQIKEKALFDCERGQAPKATTDQFKCGRCGQRKCTYYQLQTRSADEPMTTFVTCVNCNNHWKFC